MALEMTKAARPFAVHLGARSRGRSPLLPLESFNLDNTDLCDLRTSCMLATCQVTLRSRSQTMQGGFMPDVSRWPRWWAG
jgi:hypothetical protein